MAHSVEQQPIAADSASDPETASAQYKALVSKGSKMVIAGVTSGEAKAMLPESADYKCQHITKSHTEMEWP